MFLLGRLSQAYDKRQSWEILREFRKGYETRNDFGPSSKLARNQPVPAQMLHTIGHQRYGHECKSWSKINLQPRWDRRTLQQIFDVDIFCDPVETPTQLPPVSGQVLSEIYYRPCNITTYHHLKSSRTVCSRPTTWPPLGNFRLYATQIYSWQILCHPCSWLYRLHWRLKIH
jgi:hypothetical protein